VYQQCDADCDEFCCNSRCGTFKDGVGNCIDYSEAHQGAPNQHVEATSNTSQVPIIDFRSRFFFYFFFYVFMFPFVFSLRVLV